MEEMISIILPCYNQGIYLGEALESIIKQTYRNWEAIIVNDGSSDCTEEVALEYVAKDSRIHYFAQENKGVSAARNLGIEKALGKFVLPLDPDDMIAPTFIEKCMRMFKEHNDCILAYTKTSFVVLGMGIGTYLYTMIIKKSFSEIALYVHLCLSVKIV